MKKIGFGLIACVLAFSATGCFKHSYTVGTGGNTNAEAKYSEWHSHWLYGIIGEENVDVKKVCPSGNATIKSKTSFVNGLIGWLIGIVYYPTTVEIYCDGGAAKAASIQLTPEQALKVAKHADTMAFAKSVSDAKAAELAEAIAIFEHRQANLAKANGTTKF